MKKMKLNAWAKQQGVSYRTAWNWYKAGQLPARAHQTPTGTILVEVADESPAQTSRAAIYARVSSHDQKPQLDGQVGRCLAFANGAGLSVVQTVTEVGSGLNGHRKKLLALLGDPKVDVIVVEHRDRLMCFGAEHVEAALTARGARLMVVDETELTDDLVTDMIAVLTSFCARLYGRRSAANRAKAISRTIYTTLTGLAVRLLCCAKGHIGPAMLALARLADERQSFASGYNYSWQ